MLKHVIAATCALCLPVTASASESFSKEGNWQGLLSADGCVIWSVAVTKPNAQIAFRHNELGVSLDLGAAAWGDSGTTFKAGSDGFHEAFMFDVEMSDGVTMDVVPAGHVASLIEKHRPTQLSEVRSFLAGTSASNVDIGILDKDNVPLGRFSTNGYIPMMEKFEACVAERSS